VINGLKTDIASIGLERGTRVGEKSSRDSFANELKDAHSAKSQPMSERGESLKTRIEARRQRPKSDSKSNSRPQDENDGSSANPNALANPNSGLRNDLRPQEQATQQQSSQNSESASQETKKSIEVKPAGVGAASAMKSAKPQVSKEQGAKELAVTTETEAQPQGETLEMLEAFGQEQSIVKQKAIGEFMMKMKNEFGIEPEKIVEAFTKLDRETLLAPPEQAMNQVISKLDLDTDEIPRAEELFSEMVRETGAAELGEKFASLEDGVNFEVLSAREAMGRKLDQSLDRMNDRFFERGAEKAAARPITLDEMNAQIARLANQKAAQPKNETLTSSSAALATAALASGETSQMSQVGESEEPASAMPQVQATESGREGFMPSLRGLASNDSKFSFDGGMNQQSGQGSSDSSATAQKNLMGQLKNSEASAKGKKLSAEFASAMRGPKVAADEVASTDLASSTAGAGLMPGASKAPGEMVTGPAGMMVTGPQQNDQSDAENIKEVIKQAQVMLKRGGGEMKLEMSPEGMGQLHLKVAVENGRVNVQMVTETDSAKKMIENGLHELKASLAAHKLHVDRMQIDIGGEIQKHMDQQANQDSSRQQARQMAQDFLGQFRDDREGFRQSMFGGFGSRGYGREQRRTSINPEPTVTQSAARAKSQGTGGDRRLNLVA
jgi:flagellar hook-length control protein FliK